MLKRVLAVFLLMLTLLTVMPVFAADEPVVYKTTVTVTPEGGRYQVGFVNVEFKKEFITADALPMTFDIEVYQENGIAYIGASIDTSAFCKKVHVRVDHYDGLLYDKGTEKNAPVSIKKQQLLLEHFSRYAFQ